MFFFVIPSKLRELHTFSAGPSSAFVISTVPDLTGVPFLDAGASFDARHASAKACRSHQVAKWHSPLASHLDSIFRILRLFLASTRRLLALWGELNDTKLA